MVFLWFSYGSHGFPWTKMGKASPGNQMIHALWLASKARKAFLGSWGVNRKTVPAVLFLCCLFRLRCPLQYQKHQHFNRKWTLWWTNILQWKMAQYSGFSHSKMVIFHGKMLVHQRVYHGISWNGHLCDFLHSHGPSHPLDWYRWSIDWDRFIRR